MLYQCNYHHKTLFDHNSGCFLKNSNPPLKISGCALVVDRLLVLCNSCGLEAPKQNYMKTQIIYGKCSGNFLNVGFIETEPTFCSDGRCLVLLQESKSKHLKTKIKFNNYCSISYMTAQIYYRYKIQNTGTWALLRK